MAILKAIMIGDIVGEPGLAVLESCLPALKHDTGADFVVVNGENAADGFGMTAESLKRILDAGADAVTSGNHVWEKKEFWPALEAERRMLRPANYPAGTPGRGWYREDREGVSWVVISLQGREFMPAIDCPFRSFDAVLESLGGSVSPAPSVILVDFHAESSREKEALAYYLDGRAGLVAGTHTHVQTADERLLPRGTAYITDLGMTGVSGGIIGMDPKICLDRARTQILYRMEVAKASDSQPPVIKGVLAEIDKDTGRALSIARLSVPGKHPV
ncbi:MAG: YmdB family metallophosphoesterase [Spirochaetaceae bacterium]|jgi:metallophosphoesterase (TIGR00282 family)|nr:YmdB family metallophosphoesterase [Spirochaetaceae bacterium]